MKEEWKVLGELFSNYEVSNLGNVRCKNTDGTYKRVCFSHGMYHNKRQKRFYAVCDDLNGDDVFFYVAETVYKLFGEKPLRKFETVIFIDGNPENCAIDNLKVYKGDTKAMYASHCTSPGQPVRLFKADSKGNKIEQSELEFGSAIAASEYIGVSSGTVRSACNTGKMITRYRLNIILGRYYAEWI